MPISRRFISADRVTTSFGPDNSVVAVVSPGERLRVQVRDAYDGFFDGESDISSFLQARSPAKMNPATGPLRVEGANPGDALAVTIEAIKLGPVGWVAATPDTGIAGAVAVEPAVSRFLVRGDGLYLDGKLRLPLRPMLGTIGVAPADRNEIALQLGEYGGNLDINEVAPGATIHLPVQVAGALLALGDVHAAMGYGEAHSGVNTPATVDLTVELISPNPHRGIWIETLDRTGNGRGSGQSGPRALPRPPRRWKSNCRRGWGSRRWPPGCFRGRPLICGWGRPAATASTFPPRRYSRGDS